MLKNIYPHQRFNCKFEKVYAKPQATVKRMKVGNERHFNDDNFLNTLWFVQLITLNLVLQLLNCLEEIYVKKTDRTV